jgi:hypothetical protein
MALARLQAAVAGGIEHQHADPATAGSATRIN